MKESIYKNYEELPLFLRNYAMERFLERLSASKYRNCFILKGGMLISAMVGIDSRATWTLTPPCATTL